MCKVNDCYLVLDRTSPSSPRWVIAEARWSRPAEAPRRLAGPGRRWLAGFGRDQLAWLTKAVKAAAIPWIPYEGEESFAARIVDYDQLPHGSLGKGWYDKHTRDADEEDDLADEDDEPHDWTDDD